MYAQSAFDLEDYREKRAHLRRYLSRRGLDEIWFATDGNFGWLLGGDNLVVRSSPSGVAALRFDGATVTVFTDTIEAPRLRAEELPDDIDLTVEDWYETSPTSMIEETAGRAAAADVPVPGLATVDPGVFRLPPTEHDCDRLRALGAETGMALEKTCRAIAPGDTEREIAAHLAERLGRRGIDAPVRLVGGEKRAPVHRHFTPTDTPIEGYAIVSVSARRGGLWVSATRTVAFDPPDWLEDRHRKATRVDVTANAATEAARGTGTAGDVFESIQEAYADVGYPGEWEQHHQGGATGYGAREWIATPGDDTPISDPSAVAWNPTIQGAKSEDSVLLTEYGIEVVTATEEWPTTAIDSLDGSLTLHRPDIIDPA